MNNSIVWEPYVAEGEGYTPPEKWGRDHWSTLLYLHSCAVDQKGFIQNNKMRCDPRLHRHFAHFGLFGNMIDGSHYLTRLKAGETQAGHDDWSCLEDLVKYEYVTAEFAISDEERPFGGGVAKIALTPLGFEVVKQLQMHRAGQKPYDDFLPLLDNQPQEIIQ